MKSFLSQVTERLVIGAMPKRQDTTSSGGPPVAKARPTNLVMQGQCNEDVSPQRLGSLVNPRKDNLLLIFWDGRIGGLDFLLSVNKLGRVVTKMDESL